MAATIYATATDLTGDDWVSQPPANVDRLLRSASFAVALACMRNPYGDAPTGNDADALRDATCAQVASWVALGIDPAKVGTDVVAPVKKSSILTGDVERDTSAQAKAAVDAAKDLCCEAVDILTAAELLWLPTAHGDPCPGGLPTYGLSGARLGVSPTWANSTDAWPFL